MRVCAALLLASVLAASENSKPPVEEVVAKLDELVQVAQYLKRVASPLLQHGAKRHGGGEHPHRAPHEHGQRSRATHGSDSSSSSSSAPSSGTANQFAVAALLPFCTDNEPRHVTLSEGACGKIQGAAAWLCSGILRLQRASCAQLAEHAFVQSVVEQVGLTPDGRGSALYGNASSKMVEVHGKSAQKKVGLWQNPTQIAGALIHVGSRVAVHRYIEVQPRATRARMLPRPSSYLHAFSTARTMHVTGGRVHRLDLLPRLVVSSARRPPRCLPRVCTRRGHERDRRMHSHLPAHAFTGTRST